MSMAAIPNEATGFGHWSLEDEQHQWDYVILGGGAAGCVLAARLAENNPTIRVLILEAGESDNIVNSQTPALFPFLLHNPKTDWCFRTVPQKFAEQRCMTQPRGKILGGSTALNAILYHRGPLSAYSRWAEMVNPGKESWGAKEALFYFKRAEGYTDSNLPSTETSGPMKKRKLRLDLETFEQEYHGLDGPWKVGYQDSFEGAKTFVEATVSFRDEKTNQVLIPRSKDLNGSSALGVNIVQTFIDRNGVRSSSARAYLGREGVVPGGKNGRGEIRVVFGVMVEKVVVDQDESGQKKVTAVVFRDHTNVPRAISALREIILSAGAFGSPHILLASGIGPVAQPSIPHVHTLPGVGRHLQDHIGISIQFQTGPNSQLHNTVVTPATLPELLEQYHADRVGPLTSNLGESAAFARMETIAPEFVAREKLQGTWKDLASGPDAPEIEFIFMPTFFHSHGLMPPPDTTGSTNYFTLIAVLMNSASEGTVKLGEGGETLIDPEYFSDSFDLRVLTEALKFLRKLGAEMLQRGNMVPGEELFPGSKIQSQEDLELFVRENAQSVYHPTSTCRMGLSPEQGDVVDAELNVHGIKGLRVVDASVFPKIPEAHTSAPTIMVAEKAADLIKQAWMSGA